MPPFKHAEDDGGGQKVLDWKWSFTVQVPNQCKKLIDTDLFILTMAEQKKAYKYVTNTFLCVIYSPGRKR